MIAWCKQRYRWTTRSSVSGLLSELRVFGDPMLRYSFNQLIRYRKWLAILCAFSALTTAIGLVVPYFTARFIDTVLVGKSVDHLRLFVGFFASICVFEIISGYFSSVYSARIHAETAFHMNLELLRHIQRLPLAFFQEHDSSYLAQRIDNDVNSIVAFALGNIINVFVSIFSLCAASFLLYSISPIWLVLFTGASAVYGTIYFAFRKPLRSWSRLNREAQNNLFSKFSQQFHYIKPIKIHSLYEDFASSLSSSFSRFLDILLYRTKLSFWFSSSGKLSQRMFVLSVFVFGGMAVIRDNLTIGNFVALNSYFSIALGGISYFLGLGRSYQDTSAAYDRILEILNQATEEDGHTILRDIRCISVKDLCFSQGSEPVLNGFSQRFTKGHSYCLVGANGSGKTTLLYLLIGLLKPDSGTIFYNDVPLEEINMAKLRRDSIAFLEQDPLLFNDSLLGNISIGLDDHGSIPDWIERFAMNELVELRESKGLSVDDHNSVISGGEKQRIAQIRTFSKNSHVVLLDEPTTGLDVESIRILRDVITEIKSDKIVVFSTHNRSMMELADFVVRF